MTRKPSNPRTFIAVGCLLALLVGAGSLTLGIAIATGWKQQAANAPPLSLGSSEVKPGAKSALPFGLGASGPPLPEPAFTEEQCNELQQGTPMSDPCVSGEIHCNQTIIGHTRGGAKWFDTKFYESKMCTPSTTDHNGGDERIYRLTMPPGEWHATVTLDTPCADLDLAAIRWTGANCPTQGSSVNQCDMWPRPGKQREYVELVSQGESSWLLVVEGKGSEEGAFGLSVLCAEGLH